MWFSRTRPTPALSPKKNRARLSELLPTPGYLSSHCATQEQEDQVRRLRHDLESYLYCMEELGSPLEMISQWSFLLRQVEALTTLIQRRARLTFLQQRALMDASVLNVDPEDSVSYTATTAALATAEDAISTGAASLRGASEAAENALRAKRHAESVAAATERLADATYQELADESRMVYDQALLLARSITATTSTLDVFAQHVQISTDILSATLEKIR